MNQDFNQQQYNDKLAQVASLAVTYAKDGTGYHSMKDAFNELCEISHANKGIDQENTIGRRTLLVQSVCIKAIHALTPYQNEHFGKHQECNTRCLIDKVTRFEDEHKHPMNIDSMTADDLRVFADFLSSDYDISMNTIVTNMTLMRTVCNWVRKQGVTNNDPFFGYDMPKALYGTPYFLTIQERDQVLDADLTDDAELAEYRDMFVFQCMVGCRHSDLVTFTPKNIIDGVLEYIPIKTKGKLGDVVRVPLIPKAMAILDGHDHGDDEPIFPKHYNFKFNDAIRRILKRAKVNRVVTVINPKTRLEEKKPISDVATSHLARRTFIGNLYRMVKDPDLVASMSGHAKGSVAFARYRVIDDDMKKSLVELIQ
ncbi:MAG: phage integrase SAM-like domain-containing protein [Bacteroidales bacterium]|nr:phage integrase SAM-like domain-containing protein [Bacteroidales bacterium]